jgi:hypothetical protein
MDDTMDMPHFEPRIRLGDALAALPMPAPERSAWPAMAARLHARPRMPSRRWPVALAASLLALALLPRGWMGLESPATDATTAAAASAQRQQLAALMAESARLERLVDASRDGGSTSAAATAVSLSLEDRLRGVDAQLASTGATDAAQQLSLWEQRVGLMRDVAAIEASRHYLASQGDSLDVALVAAY